mmetsp:Transcript_27803/g.70954  ORF Transcript_27803/g.70954 Transcript_27803/m.70954 type:complete len:200 (-) Transcript_27803:4246-4845(-)
MPWTIVVSGGSAPAEQFSSVGPGAGELRECRDWVISFDGGNGWTRLIFIPNRLAFVSLPDLTRYARMPKRPMMIATSVTVIPITRDVSFLGCFGGGEDGGAPGSGGGDSGGGSGGAITIGELTLTVIDGSCDAISALRVSTDSVSSRELWVIEPSSVTVVVTDNAVSSTDSTLAPMLCMEDASRSTVETLTFPSIVLAA